MSIRQAQKMRSLHRLVQNSQKQRGCLINFFYHSASGSGRRCQSSTSKPQDITRATKDKEKVDLSSFPPDLIRNFCIIAHVDHGKSTLSDRLLEMTGTIAAGGGEDQVLDKLPVERERGITVKAQTASMFHTHGGETYLLNLIDTPGHVDFSYEVARSLSACQGAVLLVDANQGIQAQTVANFYLAFEAELAIVPVLNKCDLPGADPDTVAHQMHHVLDFGHDEFIRVSAKHGTNVDELLSAIVDRVPSPVGERGEPLKALIFDSWYDRYRGAVCMVALHSGSITQGDRVRCVGSGKSYEVQALGIMKPDETPVTALHAGQVGYMVCGMRGVQEALVGDTVCLHGHSVVPLPGFKKVKPMVFAGVFPLDQSEYPSVRQALERLTLNDSSVTLHPDTSPALGQGWRVGVLGLLHLGVFRQRLEQEQGAAVIVTAPSVTYNVRVKSAAAARALGGHDVMLQNPLKFPDRSDIEAVEEPYVLGTIICPADHYASVLDLAMSRRGQQVDVVNIDSSRIMMKFLLPLAEILVDFFDDLKSITSGYGSFDYEEAGYQPTDVVRLRLLLNGQEVEELTSVVHVSAARSAAKVVCAKLKESIPKQMFEVVIQGAVGGKIIARETIKAVRKDVVAKCYGGDITRKMKLLKRQAEGKKRMRMVGKVAVPKDAFLQVLSRR